MMLLKIGAQGKKMAEPDLERVDRAAEAIRFAANHGARVINWSGFVDETRLQRLEGLRDAIRYAGTRNVLIVVAAGNAMKNLDEPANCSYPACFHEPNLLKVAEINFAGKLDTFSGGDRISGSNYGVQQVDVAAIGRNFSTQLRNGLSVYGTAGGTSGAAPVVAGIAALMVSARPQLTAVETKGLLLESARRLPSLSGKVACGGMVDAYAAVRLAMKP